MRTFVTGMLFLAVLAAGLNGILSLAGMEFTDVGIAQAPSGNEDPESLARFEPSSPEVVDEMLKMAAVTSDDIVYDLGCGDGRVVIAAARRHGARGVGVDIDRALVAESRRNAELADVSHLVQFVQEDLIKTGISKASVVMLYLSREANLAIRTRLLKELKPGSRVVSHCHEMGEWKPDNESEVGEHRVYVWTVPAQISGKWKMEIMDKYGSDDSFVQFSQSFQAVSAVLTTGAKNVPVTAAGLKGRAIRFTAQDASAGTVEFTGRIEGEKMSGHYRTADRAGTWNARRMRQ